MRPAALLVVLALLLLSGGCSVGAEDEPVGERFEASTFQFQLPQGWAARIDDDPSAHEEVNISAGRGVGGDIFRDPTGDETIRARIERIGSSAREREGFRSVSAVHRRADDVDGVEAWVVDATDDSALPGRGPFTTRTIGFEHDGSDWVVSFSAPAAAFDRHADALDELLETWEFL